MSDTLTQRGSDREFAGSDDEGPVLYSLLYAPAVAVHVGVLIGR